MATNNMNFISKMFVVIITYLVVRLTVELTTLDFAYLSFIVGCFIKYLKIKEKPKEEWQPFFFSL